MSSVLYAHKRDIIHRDIKSENIFCHDVDGEITLKLGDFGFVREVSDRPTK